MSVKSAVLAAVAVAATLAAVEAHAGVSWSIGINLPPVAAVVGAPVYRAPPVAYAPVPVYPAPSHGSPVYAEPVYATPAYPPPVYVPRRPVYVAPAPVYEPRWRAVPREVVYPDRGGDHRGWRNPVVVAPPAYGPPPGVYVPVPGRRW